MATGTVNLPPGFELEQSGQQPDQQAGQVNLPPGFQIEQQQAQQPSEPSAMSLFESLGKKSPTGPLPPQFLESAKGFTVPSIRFKKEVGRRKAHQELLRQGFSQESIDTTLRARGVLGGPRVGQVAGGIGGALAATAIAGRFIPGPIDDALIVASLVAAGGAGAGGAIGEAAQTAIEEKRLINRREALSAFATEAGTELGGRALVGAGKFALSPLIKKIVPEAAALVDDFAKVGGSFSPTELDNRFSLRLSESFARGGFGGKKLFQEFEEKQGKAVLAYADGIIESIGEGIARQSPEEIGEIFAQGISRPDGRVFKILDELFEPLYGQLDDMTQSSIVKQTQKISVPSSILDASGKPVEKLVDKVIGERIAGTGVSTASLKSFRNKMVSQNQRLVDIAKRTGKELPLVSPSGKQMLKDIENLPEFVGHSDYRAFRTKVLKETRKLGRDADISESLVKEVSSITRKELLDPKSVAGASREAKMLHENISNLYSASRKGLETTFSETLSKRLLKNPSSVVKEVFPANNPKSIRLLRKSLVEPISGKPSSEGKAIWNQLRQSWLADAVDQATKDGVANPNVLNKVFAKLGPKGLKEMFPEVEVRGRVAQVKKLFAQAGKKPPASLSLFVHGGQALGLGMMYQGTQEGDFVGISKGAALALGPRAFARLATSPKGIKLLTSGMKLKPGASGLVPNTIRMVRLLRDMDRREGKRKKALSRSVKFPQRRPAPSLQQLRGFGGRGF